MTALESMMTASTPTNSVDAPLSATTQAVAPPTPVTSDPTATSTEGEPKVVEGAPAAYVFTASEGRTFDNEVINTYSEIARELNLSQDSAQMMLDKLGNKVRERQEQQIDAAKQGWIDSSRSDKEFGGDAIDKNMSIAKKALDTLGTPELRTLLNESGIGNHPEVIRFFFRAGKAISADSYVGPSSGAGSRPSSPRDFASQAAAMYSNQT